MQSAPLLVACGHEILGEIGRVLTLAPLRFGLLGQEVACGHVLVTRSVNEEVLE